MVDELAAAIDAIERSNARVVLVRAEGENFSLGGDIMPWPDDTPRQLRARFEAYMDVFNRFERLPLPVIAVVHGLCAGGGFARNAAVRPSAPMVPPRLR
jgi:enoyl-CoA hydratase/carnithine racemase